MFFAKQKQDMIDIHILILMAQIKVILKTESHQERNCCYKKSSGISVSFHFKHHE